MEAQELVDCIKKMESDLISKNNEKKSLKSLLDEKIIDTNNDEQVFYQDQPVIVDIGDNKYIKRYYSHKSDGDHFVFSDGVTSRTVNELPSAVCVDKIEPDLDAKPILNWIEFKPFDDGERPDCEMVKYELTSGHQFVSDTIDCEWGDNSAISRWASLDEEL